MKKAKKQLSPQTEGEEEDSVSWLAGVEQERGKHKGLKDTSRLPQQQEQHPKRGQKVSCGFIYHGFI